MIADGGKLLLLCADDISRLALDLPVGSAFLGESTGDYDRFSIFFWFVGFLALVFESDGDLCDPDGRVRSGANVHIYVAHEQPSLMKDLSPLPRPVEVLFPPKATVMADNTALLPPYGKVRPMMLDDTTTTHFRCDLNVAYK